MRNKFTLLVILNCFLLSSCMTFDILFTYEFQESEWGNNLDYGFFDNVYFEIEKNTKIENGLRLGEKRFIYSEPYNLNIEFVYYLYQDLEKMTINAIKFYKNYETIDIRTRFIPQYNSVHRTYYRDRFYAFDDEDALLYYEHGIINLLKIKEAQRVLIANSLGLPESEINNRLGIRLFYENFDVMYGIDRYFQLELDITLEWQDGRIENSIIKTNFRRKKIQERVTFPMLYLAWLLSDN